MNTKLKLFLNVLLTLCTIAVAAFIISNSIETGAQSADKSQTVTDAVQNVTKPIIGEANTDKYITHEFVRKLAHFCEFGLFGVMLCATYLSYTNKKIFFAIPCALCVTLPIIDECVQLFSAGRAFEIADIFLDLFGATCGLFGLLILFMIICYFIRKKHSTDAA